MAAASESGSEYVVTKPSELGDIDFETHLKNRRYLTRGNGGEASNLDVETNNYSKIVEFCLTQPAQ